MKPLLRSLALLWVALGVALAGPAAAQTFIMPVGDSITQGGQGFASYRYPLYFDLLTDGYDVEFVGTRDFTYLSSPPNALDYPAYATTFDRDHEAYWGWRTDELETVVQAAAAAHLPDIVLIHLGTNDIGQNGAAGVTGADTNLRDIISLMRLEVPNATFLLARVIPIGPGSGYGANAGQVPALHAVIDAVALAMDTPASPVMVVDPHTGFDLLTMMQGDALHPNVLGEQHIADAWRASLATILPPGNPPPLAAITQPLPGASFVAGADVDVLADVSDPNGSIVEATLLVDDVPVASDTTAPYAFVWPNVAAGSYTLRVEGEDDQGAFGLSDPVAISVLPAGSGVPIAVGNPSFEQTPLGDGVTHPNPAAIPDWTFTGTTNTFVGIFNPPAASYPEAAGQGTPIGADGAQAAYLFNDGGPAEMVSASQTLGENVVAGRDYTLTVAIGRFDPAQPYSPSTYGGYRIELLAGATVIASDVDSITPPEREFADATAIALSTSIPPALIGQPLSIRLDISATAADRSTHFDHVRVTWSQAAPVPALGTFALGVLACALVFVGLRAGRERVRARA